MKMASEVAWLPVRCPLLAMLHCRFVSTEPHKELCYEKGSSWDLLKKILQGKKAKRWISVHSSFYSIHCHILKEWRQMFGWTLLSIPPSEWTSSSQRLLRRTGHHNSCTHCTGTKPFRFPLLSRRNPSVSSFFPIQICSGREGERRRARRRKKRRSEWHSVMWA